MPSGYLAGGYPTAWSTLDGSLAAAGGTAQHVTWLNGYSVRPPWSVAGVDYAVGPHSGTSFTDITVSQPANTTYSAAAKTLTVNADNVTIDGYDFTGNNGIALYDFSFNNLIVKNCKFGGTNYRALPTGVVDFRGANLTFEYNTIDGAGSGGADSQSTLISVGTTATGAISIRYNWLKNYPQHILELITANAPLTFKYNMIDECILATSAHMNWIQIDPTTGTFTINAQFNIGRQSLTGGAEGFQFYSTGATSALSSPVCRYNTLLAVTAAAMTNMLHASAGAPSTTTLSGTATMADNYFDHSGATNAFYPNSLVGWTVSGNKNMSNGLTIAADNSES